MFAFPSGRRKKRAVVGQLLLLRGFCLMTVGCCVRTYTKLLPKKQVFFWQNKSLN